MVRPRLVASVALVVALLLSGCATPPSGPCLNDAQAAVSLPFARLVTVSHEAEGGIELVRFLFDPSVPGEVTVTATPAEPGRYTDDRFGEPVDIAGGDLTSMQVVGLVGGADSDRLTSDDHLIGGVYQVRDPVAPRWIIDPAPGTCRRLRSDATAGTVSLIVTVP